MNERIKELSKKSGLFFVTDREDLIGDFAEYLIRECGKSCTLQGDEDDMFSKFGIKKHTGTE